MKYCINGNEGKIVLNKGSICCGCLLSSFHIWGCADINACDLTHIISKSENTSLIFTL